VTRKDITYLYEKYSKRLYNISFRILSSQYDAEEVMQDCFIKYYNKTIPFLNEAMIASWLTKVCIHASLDRLRQRKRGEVLLENVAQESDVIAFQPIEETVEALTPQDVILAIQQLPSKHRVILDLVLIEGLDYSEISAYLGEKEGTLRAQFSRSRAELIRVLKSIKK